MKRNQDQLQEQQLLTMRAKSFIRLSCICTAFACELRVRDRQVDSVYTQSKLLYLNPLICNALSCYPTIGAKTTSSPNQGPFHVFIAKTVGSHGRLPTRNIGLQQCSSHLAKSQITTQVERGIQIRNLCNKNLLSYRLVCSTALFFLVSVTKLPLH